MLGTFPLSFATEYSVIKEDLLPFTEVKKQTSIPLYKWFVGFHFFFSLQDCLSWWCGKTFLPSKRAWQILGNQGLQ